VIPFFNSLNGKGFGTGYMDHLVKMVTEATFKDNGRLLDDIGGIGLPEDPRTKIFHDQRMDQPVQLPEELLWRPYKLERFYVVAPNRYRGKTDEELLSRGPYLRHKPQLLEETMIDREMKRRGIKADPVMEFDSYENILLMVEHNVGIGIVPDFYLSEQRFAKLHCVTFGTPPLTREMGLMVRRDSPNLHVVDLLWEAIKESSRRPDKPRLRGKKSR
jgi:hypothetical protein